MLEPPIRLLFDNPRPEREIDRLLQPRALVVEPIDGTRELDEGAAEVAARIAIADCILDVPELRIQPFELCAEFVQRCAIYVTERNRPQCLELVHDILELARILDALGLYFEDPELWLPHP